jgi:hypothetical protein
MKLPITCCTPKTLEAILKRKGVCDDWAEVRILGHWELTSFSLAVCRIG